MTGRAGPAKKAAVTDAERHCGSWLGVGHDEREQTLNQMLVETEGFDTSMKIIVSAATNRPDILDPALLRVSRFDRRVVLDPPDSNGRKAILEVHASEKSLDSEVDLETKQTPGFSGAHLASLVNEIALFAAMRNKKKIGLEELEESIDRVQKGPERRSCVISKKGKDVVVYHEAGHVLVARLLPNADPVHKISIVARGRTGGYTKYLPTEDRHLYSISQLRDIITTCLGGYAAEEVMFGKSEVSTGFQNNLERVSDFARRMVKEYGISERMELRTFGRKEELLYLRRMVDEQKDYRDKAADEIDTRDRPHNCRSLMTRPKTSSRRTEQSRSALRRVRRCSTSRCPSTKGETLRLYSRAQAKGGCQTSILFPPWLHQRE